MMIIYIMNYLIFKMYIAKLLVLTFVDFFIGFIWYSDYLFANAWIKAMGISKDKIYESNPNMPKLFGIQMLLNLISIFIHAYMLSVLNPVNVLDSMQVLLLVFNLVHAYGKASQ